MNLHEPGISEQNFSGHIVPQYPIKSQPIVWFVGSELLFSDDAELDSAISKADRAINDGELRRIVWAFSKMVRDVAEDGEKC